MPPLTCANCQKDITSALWDNQTKQFYCSQCVPPLPTVTHPEARSKKGPRPGMMTESKARRAK
jgi:hypothetical protein